MFEFSVMGHSNDPLLFESDLSLLENGANIFFCKNLTLFKSKLPKLETPDNMFNDCV